MSSPSTKLGALWLAVGLSVTAVASHAAEIEESRPQDAGGAVRVDIAYGEVSIVAGTPGRVVVRGEVGPEIRGVSLRREAGALEVRVRYPFFARLQTLWSDEPLYRADLVIEVPADTRLFVVSRDARIEIDGIEGPVGVGVVSSDILVRGTPAQLAVETISGSLVFEGGTRSLEAITMSGSLHVVGVSGRARLEAVTGELSVRGKELRSARLSTVSGDVVFAGRVAVAGELEIETESGAVTLMTESESGADIDLSTRDGEIRNELDAVAPRRDERGHRRLETTLGDGSGRMRVRTRSGLIQLKSDPGATTP